jgi:type IV pilus assembly protein PilF
MRLPLERMIAILAVVGTLSSCATPNNHSTNKVASQSQDAASYNTQLGLGYLQQGEMERAKAKLNKAMAQAPEVPSVHAAMAFYHEKTGDSDLADTEYRKAISLNPRGGEALNNYGAFLCGRGEYQKAINYFLQAIKDPSYTTTAQAYENAGLCALKMPNQTLALQYFEKTLQQDPSRSAALLEMSQFYFNKENYPLASTYIERYKKESAPTARSLLLDIRIAHELKEDNTVASNALFLKNLFPHSAEYRAMQAMGIQ